MGSRKGNLPGGLLIPERCVFDKLAANTGGATTSSYTEAGPRPGHPVAGDANSQLRLEMSGEQGVDVNVQVVKAGMPARDGLQLAIQDETNSGAMLTWDGPGVCTDFIPLDWGADDTEDHAIATIPSTQKVVVAAVQTSGSAVKLRVIDTDHSVTEQAATISSGTDWNYPALVVLPGSERILCFYGGAAYYTDDEGATWSTLSTSITGETTTNYGPTVAAFYRNTIVMLVEDTATAETIHHLVSTDGGASFQLVQSTASLGVRVDCVANDDGLHIAWVDSAAAVEYRKLGQPFEPLDAVAQTVLGTGSQYVECCIWSDGAGSLYVMSGDYRGFIFGSHDAGESWGISYKSRGVQFLDTNDRPSKYRATYALGQAFIVTGFYDGTSYATSRPGVVVLGGWSDLQIVGNSLVQPYKPENRWGFSAKDAAANSQGQTWFPWALPHNQGWTDNGGSGTATIDDTNMALHIDSLDFHRSWAKDLGTTPVSIVCRFTVGGVVSGSTTQQDIAVTLRLADASSYEYEAEILLSASAIYVNDVNGAGTQNASVTLSSGYTQIMAWIDLSDEAIVVAYRSPGSTDWTVMSAVSLTDAGATANNCQIEWGHLDNDADSESYWREFHYCAASANQPELASAIASRYSRAFNARPEPIPDMGTSSGAAWLAAVSGPAIHGETFDIDAHHDYPVEHFHPELFPGRGSRWRSTDTSEQIFCYDLGANAWVGHSVGLFIADANFRTAYLESYNGSSWDTEATLDLAQGFGETNPLEYTLSGETVYPDTGATNDAGRWMWEQELRNGVAIFNASGGPTQAATRILAQSAGGWSQTATVIPMLQLEDVSVISGLSGTKNVKLCAPAGLVVAHQATSPKVRRYWRIRIPSGTAGDDTPEGESYYEASVMAICRVQPFGAPVGWGNREDTEANIATAEDRGGTVRARELGVERRRWTLGGWASAPTNHGWGVRLSAAPDYVSSSESNALGLAGFEDVLHHLRGLLRVMKGGAIPCIAVEPLPDASDTTLNDPTRFLYGRMTSSVSGSRLVGDYDNTGGAGEVMRVDDITIEEIV